MSLEQELIDKLDQIRITKRSNRVEVSNPTSFRLIGNGAQGAVFQIDEHRCVKIYCAKQSLVRELHALQLGNKIDICPKVYFWGENFIVMEYLTCPSLFEYLEKNPLTKELTIKIIDVLESFEQIGFNRYDHSARHIYVVPDGKMKVIDLVHIIKPNTVLLAKKLISDMGAKAEDFVRFVQDISPKWYNRWAKQPGFATLMQGIKADLDS
jgi:predicted Ser/Thr protein kinase